VPLERIVSPTSPKKTRLASQIRSSPSPGNGHGNGRGNGTAKQGLDELARIALGLVEGPQSKEDEMRLVDQIRNQTVLEHPTFTLDVGKKRLRRGTKKPVLRKTGPRRTVPKKTVLRNTGLGHPQSHSTPTLRSEQSRQSQSPGNGSVNSIHFPC
jgi:hypothetical protein